MSGRILNALMQLFAIIARPGGSMRDRRSVVELFLNQQLNKDIADQYLSLYDKHILRHQQKNTDSAKKEKILSLNSVKVIKICDGLKSELTQQQKVIIIIRLWEFAISDGQVSQQEVDFITLVAQVFNISANESENIFNFVTSDFNDIRLSPSVLLIDGTDNADAPHAVYLHCNGLSGELKVLEIDSARLHALRSNAAYNLKIAGLPISKTQSTILKSGIAIRESRIETIYYSEIVAAFTQHTRHINFILEAEDISYKYQNSDFGVSPMSFSLKSGELVSIQGGSGSGKSTLLNILNGKYKPQTGGVRISGVAISESEKLEGIIGYVSQDDRLIEDLTVFQNLFYTAQLCFREFSSGDLKRLCINMLQKLDLEHLKNQVVGTPLNKTISGGQRKRLNIALELIREPAILYLDEPTSGLSSRDSEHIMDLLKELALKGKLVVTVIHQPSSEIFKMFDRLLVIDQGGYLIYNGNPVEAIRYFKTNTYQANWTDYECSSCGTVAPEQIFDIVEANVLDEFGKKSRERKITALNWSEKWINYSKGKTLERSELDQLPEKSFYKPGRWKQIAVFFLRDIRSKIARKQYLYLNFLLTPVLAFVLAYLIKYSSSAELEYTYGANQNITIYLFMAIVIALFVGLTTSGEEIIKDRKTVERESFLGLSRGGYLLSKIAVLLILSALQALLFVSVANTVLEINGLFWDYWLILFSCWVFSNLLGLNVSDAMKWPVSVYVLIPFIIIPQIVLSGVLIRYDKLNPNLVTHIGVPLVGEFITARWAFEALAVRQHNQNEYQQSIGQYDALISKAQFKLNFLIPELKQIANGNSQKEENIIQNHLNEEKQHLADGFGQALAHPDSLDFCIGEVESFYRQVNSIATKMKDSLIFEKEGRLGLEEFRRFKLASYNETLNDFVRNNDSPVKMLVANDWIIQKSDPIFRASKKAFFQSHFLAPSKRMFGYQLDTFVANVLIIWLAIIGMYLTLYFSLLKKIVEPIQLWKNRK